MKTAAYILIALLGGLMLGSWSIKADLRKATSEIDCLKVQLAQKGGQPSSLNGITSMLNLPEVKPEPARSKHTHPVRPATPPANAPALSPAGSPPPSSVATFPAGSATNAHAMQTQLQTAAALWKVRADLAQNSYISNVTTNEAQAMDFAVSMAAMNLRLSNSIRTWVDQIKKEKTLTPEKSILMFNDLSSTLVWAYKDLDRTQPADWRQKAGPKFQVLDFINPEVALPLVEAEGLFTHANSLMGGDELPDSP
ncbi:MAG: hypothetical protein WCS52_14560 [bacterium]